MSSASSIKAATSTSAVAAATNSVTPVGVLQGSNPLNYSPSDPLVLFSVQVLSPEARLG
jgi:hypothetical protein